MHMSLIERSVAGIRNSLVHVLQLSWCAQHQNQYQDGGVSFRWRTVHTIIVEFTWRDTVRLRERGSQIFFKFSAW